MTRHGLSLRALHMSMTHTPERRRIPHLDSRWWIDPSGQVWKIEPGKCTGRRAGKSRVEAARGKSLGEAMQRAPKRLAGTRELVHTTPPEPRWCIHPDYLEPIPVGPAVTRTTVEWLKWNPRHPSGTVQSTGSTWPAAGDTSRDWFHLESDGLIHFFHGPSIAAFIFRDLTHN